MKLHELKEIISSVDSCYDGLDVKGVVIDNEDIQVVIKQNKAPLGYIIITKE